MRGACLWSCYCVLAFWGGTHAREHSFKQSREVSCQGECGTWQDAYIKLQSQILSGERPPAYAVALSTKQGFADQLLGAISTFYYALLTDRAIQISLGNQTHKLPLESVYGQPNINWTASQDYAQYVRHAHGEDVPTPLYAYTLHDSLMVGVDSMPAWAPWLKAPNASAMHQEEPVALFLMNRDTTQHLFSNPYTSMRLSEMGLREDTAFGCVMNL